MKQWDNADHMLHHKVFDHLCQSVLRIRDMKKGNIAFYFIQNITVILRITRKPVPYDDK